MKIKYINVIKYTAFNVNKTQQCLFGINQHCLQFALGGYDIDNCELSSFQIVSIRCI